MQLYMVTNSRSAETYTVLEA